VTIVIDASVALKWVLDEDDSDLARELALHEALVAPDLIYAECANSLWVKVRRKQLTATQAANALTAIQATPIRAVATQHHTASALAIAFELDRTAYDCLYLAVAVSERLVFVTADQAFARSAHAHSSYAQSVRLLVP
jgi:predicted nucleic acid-binding protein